MNLETLKGQWKQIRGSIKETWAELTDDDLMAIDGRRDKLAGILQQRYGVSKVEAER